MPRKITKYRCEHCRREYVREELAIEHEANCYHDLNNKACATCKFYNNPETAKHRGSMCDLDYDRVPDGWQQRKKGNGRGYGYDNKGDTRQHMVRHIKSNHRIPSTMIMPNGGKQWT